MVAVKSLCRRAIWLDEGRIVEAGEAVQVVQDYLQQGTLSLQEQVWENPVTAPGNEKVRIHSARISRLAQDTGEQISVETPIQLEFEFWNYVPDAILNLTMHLFTIEGTYVLAVGSDAKPRHQGLVRGVVKIPPHFLNDGIYTVTLQIVRDMSSTLCLHPDILVFEVHDSTRTGSWFGKWPGVVRPKFEWRTEDVAENGSIHERSQ